MMMKGLRGLCALENKTGSLYDLVWSRTGLYIPVAAAAAAAGAQDFRVCRLT